MSYVPPFHIIKDRFTFGTNGGAVQASIDYDQLNEVIQLYLRAVEVDEDWYCETYPDIADSIAKGVISSAKQHYVENGYFEGRLPYPMPVDTGFYTEAYPDIAEGVERGEIESVESHFREHGYTEGRLPAAY